MAISPTDIQILFTNYDITAHFLNLASCSEHFISIKHRILATFNIKKKKKKFELLYAFKSPYFICLLQKISTSEEGNTGIKAESNEEVQPLFRRRQKVRN
jgi:hypothetical protein